MSQELIIIIMLCYVMFCIIIYFVASKYWFKKRTKSNYEEKKTKSVLDELEMETNIFDISPDNQNGLQEFEIDSPYENKSTDEFIELNEDDIIDDKIKKLLDD